MKKRKEGYNQPPEGPIPRPTPPPPPPPVTDNNKISSKNLDTFRMGVIIKVSALHILSIHREDRVNCILMKVSPDKGGELFYLKFNKEQFDNLLKIRV